MGNSELFSENGILSGAILSAELDLSYEGELDLYTGLPLEDESGTPMNAVISENSSYDLSQHMFYFSAKGGIGGVYSTVAADMITTDQVVLRQDEESGIVVYCDGEVVENPFDEPLTRAGNYNVVIQGADTEQLLYSFTIVTQKTGAVTSYPLPQGFYLVSVEKDGVPQVVIGTNSVDLQEEGVYTINYRCAATSIDYYLNVEIDHTPPEIVLAGVEGDVARGPVTVTGLESTDTIEMLYEGESEKFSSDGVLTMPGNYTLVVTDGAGNTATHEFRILMYLNKQGIWFGLLFIAVLVAAGTYIFVTRKRLRVQ